MTSTIRRRVLASRVQQLTFIAGLVIVTAMGLLDAAWHVSFLGALVLGVFVASIGSSSTQVVIVAIYTLLWTIWLGFDEQHWTASHFTRIAINLSAAGIALAVVAVRKRLATALARSEDVAEAAQQALLRPLDKRYGNSRLAVRFVSAFDGARVGGDVYDAQSTPWGLRLLVADVCGHGLGAVTKSSALVFSFREAAHSHRELSGVTEAMEASFSRQVAGEVDFASGVVMQVRGREVQIANCGHPDPLLIDSVKATWLSPPKRTRPFGFVCDPHIRRLTLPPRGRILLYTDGATEARNDRREEFDIETAALESFSRNRLEDSLDELLARLKSHTGGQLRDDVVLLGVEVR